MKAEHFIVINSSLEKSYKVAETYPLFVKSFKEKKIIRSDSESSKVRITNNFFLIPLTWEGASQKKINQSINWIQTNGLLQGLRAEWVFTSLNKKQTKVTIKGEYSGNGAKSLLLGIIAPLLIKKAATTILQQLKLATESEG